MKVNGQTGAIVVGRDSSGGSLEVETQGRVVLTPDGARRLAAAILYEAAKLEPSERVALYRHPPAPGEADIPAPMRRSA